MLHRGTVQPAIAEKLSDPVIPIHPKLSDSIGWLFDVAEGERPLPPEDATPSLQRSEPGEFGLQRRELRFAPNVPLKSLPIGLNSRPEQAERYAGLFPFAYPLQKPQQRHRVGERFVHTARRKLGASAHAESVGIAFHNRHAAQVAAKGLVVLVGIFVVWKFIEPRLQAHLRRAAKFIQCRTPWFQRGKDRFGGRSAGVGCQSPGFFEITLSCGEVEKTPATPPPGSNAVREGPAQGINGILGPYRAIVRGEDGDKQRRLEEIAVGRHRRGFVRCIGKRIAAVRVFDDHALPCGVGAPVAKRYDDDEQRGGARDEQQRPPKERNQFGLVRHESWQPPATRRRRPAAERAGGRHAQGGRR